MFRLFGGPEAKAIVVFGGEDELFHAGLGGGARDLAGVKIHWIEDLFAFVALVPFLVSESVDCEMEETDEFHFLPLKLARAGHRSVRSGRVGGGGDEAVRDAQRGGKENS